MSETPRRRPRPSYAESDESDEATRAKKQKVKVEVKDDDDSDSESDVPLSSLKRKPAPKKSPATPSKSPAKKKVEVKDDDDSDSDSESDVPLSSLKRKPAPKKSPATPSKSPAKKKAVKRKASSDSDGSPVPAKRVKSTSKSPAKKRVKTEDSANGTPEKKGRAKKVAPEEMEVNRWWESDKKLPEGHKWASLKHKGILFPPPHTPHGVKMLYNGEEVTLTPEQEEVATWYAAMLETDYVKKELFNKNFFHDFLECLNKGNSKKKKHVIQKLELCDFGPIHRHVKQMQEMKKQRSKEEKQAEKEEKERLRQIYGVAEVDGVIEKVSNWVMEPPGLFRGRGEHPKMGCIKRRVRPEEVTLNLSEDAEIPECPIPGHNWKEIVHNPQVTWLASWKDTVMNEPKYVFLAPSSRFRGEKDIAKYEKARELKKHIGKIREDYLEALSSESMASAQLATAIWVIDHLALRVGNEKDTEEEADTVGCCSLRVEHVRLAGNNTIELDFLGKDSIRYFKSHTVIPQVYKNVKRFMEGKDPEKQLFDELNPTKMNKHLSSLMPGLSAKVFRTYNASVTLEKCLKESLEKALNTDLDEEKLNFYNLANREVAILCNHQKAAPKNFDAQMEKMEEKIAAAELAWQDAKDEVKQLSAMLSKGKGGKLDLPIRDDPEEEGIDEKEKKKRETEAAARTKKVSAEQVEGLLEKAKRKVDRLKLRAAKLRIQQKTREDQKTVALGTSKINYCDPRITVAWCKATGLPLSKVFNKSLLDKFPWAFQNPDVTADWEF